LLSRDHADGRATWQPQGVGSEAYLNGTSQGPTPEDARKDGHIRGRSKLFMNYPGWAKEVKIYSTSKTWSLEPVHDPALRGSEFNGFAGKEGELF
jgi:hypothetical protein